MSVQTKYWGSYDGAETSVYCAWISTQRLGGALIFFPTPMFNRKTIGRLLSRLIAVAPKIYFPERSLFVLELSLTIYLVPLDNATDTIWRHQHYRSLDYQVQMRHGLFPCFIGR